MIASRFILLLLAASLASAETFHVTTAPSAASLNEIATIIRTVGGIKQVTADAAKFDIAVDGSQADVALAAWIVNQLDTTQPAPAQYTVAGDGSVVSILYTANSAMPAMLNELVTSVRVNADVQRIFTYSPLHAMVFRADPAKVQLTEWLVKQLDVSPNDQARFQIHQMPMPDIPGEIVQVVYLLHPTTQKGLNEVVTTLRTVANVQRIFTRSEPHGISFRGMPQQMQLANWLIQQLDVAQPDAAMRAATHEYQIPGADEVTRVYYLTGADPSGVATAVRSDAGLPKIFFCAVPKALAVRGGPDAIAIADRIVKEHDGPAAP